LLNAPPTAASSMPNVPGGMVGRPNLQAFPFGRRR
jgi:hypothetical protein